MFPGGQLFAHVTLNRGLQPSRAEPPPPRVRESVKASNCTEGGMNRREGDTVSPMMRSIEIDGGKCDTCPARVVFGASRFEEIQIQKEATLLMSATVLESVVADRIVERHPYQETSAPYRVILALRTRGETRCQGKSEEVAVPFAHRVFGHEFGLDWIYSSYCES